MNCIVRLKTSVVLLDIIDIIYIYSVDQLALTHIPAELVGRSNIPMKVKVDGDGLSGCSNVHATNCLPTSLLVFNGNHIAQSPVFCAVFRGSSCLSFHPLYCLLSMTLSDLNSLSFTFISLIFIFIRLF